jgi:hypothetical protein
VLRRPELRLTYIKARHRGLLTLIVPNLKLLAVLLREGEFRCLR